MSEPDPLLEALLASGVKIPVPSGTLLRVQALIADDDAGTDDLVRAVGQDPVLAGELMRVANSPVFRTRSPARSLKAAVTILGRTRTMALVASHALRAQLGGVPPRVLDMLWSAAASAADYAYRAAQAFGYRDKADLAYLAALVHDIGIAVLLRRYPEHAGLFDVPVSQLDAAAWQLDTVTGATHAGVGATVARHWRLPVEVVEAIALHHQPVAAGEAAPEVALLATLMAIARRLRDGPSPEWEVWALFGKSACGLEEDGLAVLARPLPSKT